MQARNSLYYAVPELDSPHTHTCGLAWRSTFIITATAQPRTVLPLKQSLRFPSFTIPRIYTEGHSAQCHVYTWEGILNSATYAHFPCSHSNLTPVTHSRWKELWVCWFRLRLCQRCLVAFVDYNVVFTRALGISKCWMEKRMCLHLKNYLGVYISLQSSLIKCILKSRPCGVYRRISD